MKYITDITDGNKRTYKGYYDIENDTYILKYTNDTKDDIIKKSMDIKPKLFSPFYQLKTYHINY